MAYFDEMRGLISAIISAEQLFKWFEISYDNFFYIKSCYNAFESVLSIDIISCVTCTIIIKIKTNDDVAQATTAKHIQRFLIIKYIISVKV